MGLAISRVIRRDGYDYKAADPLELRHLGMSDLEETLNDQTGAPALDHRASWSVKVQVRRIFGAALDLHQRTSEHRRGSIAVLFAMLLLGLVLVSAKTLFAYQLRADQLRALLHVLPVQFSSV